MTTEKTKPADTLRDGSIKATIWKNSSEKGDFYGVEFSRTYKSGEEFRDSKSFSGAELLRLAYLAQRAYQQVADLRAADAVQADAEAPAETAA